MLSRQVFFVCGAPKSGTTWLQRILDAHPEIQCSGEGHFIERFTVPLAAILRDYAGHMDLVASRIYEGRPYYPAVTQNDLDRLARRFILDRLTERRPARQIRWIGDKTPAYARSLPQLLRLFPHARFINIIRDPRDVAMARFHHAKRAGITEDTLQSPPDRARFIQTGALDWAQCVAAVHAFTAEHPTKVHWLRYEDMIDDPAGEARRIYRFLSVRHERALIARIVAATSFETQSGRAPGDEDEASFLRKGIVGDWVGRLAEPDLSPLYEACGRLMQDHGYVANGSLTVGG